MTDAETVTLEDDVDVVMIEERQVLMRSGAILSIEMFVDDEDDECEPEDAAGCIAVTDDDVAIYVTIFPAETVH